MNRKFELVVRCVDIPQAAVQDLFDLYEAEHQVTFDTFARHCNWKPVAQAIGYAVGAERGLKMRKDRCVRFYRSVWRGKPCYYMDWSAIDHVFQ